MNTTLVTEPRSFSRAQRTEARYWPTISAGESWRPKPDQPVAQNLHRSAHPAWEEMQRVSRSRDGIRTLSTTSPPRSFHRCFAVPSREIDTVSVSGSSNRNAAARAARSRAGRFVMSAKDCAVLPKSHSRTCLAR